MTSRRSRLIEEMGLGPVWVLRNKDVPEALDRAGDNVPGDQATMPTELGTGKTAATAGMRPAAQRVESRPPVRQREAASAATARGPGHSRMPPRPVAPEFPGMANAERDGLIARMDWTALKAAVSGCASCGLATTRTQTVFGVGDELADWMLVGEAPDSEEDMRGEPLVGQAGKLLDNMLFAIDLVRDKNVYIANVLKCRPPGNRNPMPEEVARCSPHLARQVALVQPKLILAMGRFAALTLLDTDASIASLRGKLHRYQGVPVIVTYHPAYLLRNLLDKAKAWEDLVFARKTMASLKTAVAVSDVASDPGPPA